MNENERVGAEALVKRFLAATSHLSDPEAAAVLGVTHTTIGRWKVGWGKEKGWKKLQAGTRRKIIDFLRTHAESNEAERERSEAGGAPPAPGEHPAGAGGRVRDAADVGEGVPTGALDSFWKRVDDIHALPISDGMKVLRVDALAAAIRAEYARQAESAAEARARAVERAESGAEARAKAIERAEESARDRARALGESGAGGVSRQDLVEDVLHALTERAEAAAKKENRNQQ